MPMVAWYILSKESYMKRVIRDVLPTEIRRALVTALDAIYVTAPYHFARPGIPVWPCISHFAL